MFGRDRFHEKRSGAWRVARKGVTHSIDLQKSQYARRYFINIRIDFSGAVTDAHEPIRCFLDGRIGDLLSEAERDKLDELLDMELSGITDELREHELLRLLNESVGPVLDEVETLEGIRKRYRSGGFDEFIVSKSAANALAN